LEVFNEGKRLKIIGHFKNTCLNKQGRFRKKRLQKKLWKLNGHLRKVGSICNFSLFFYNWFFYSPINILNVYMEFIKKAVVKQSYIFRKKAPGPGSCI